MGPTFEVKCRVLFIFFFLPHKFRTILFYQFNPSLSKFQPLFCRTNSPQNLVFSEKKGRPSTIIRFCLQPNSYFLVINSGEENSRSCNNYFGYVLLIIFLFCVFLFLFSYYLFKVRSFPLFVDENLAGFVFLQLHIRYVLVSVHA